MAATATATTEKKSKFTAQSETTPDIQGKLLEIQQKKEQEFINTARGIVSDFSSDILTVSDALVGIESDDENFLKMLQKLEDIKKLNARILDTNETVYPDEIQAFFEMNQELVDVTNYLKTSNETDEIIKQKIKSVEKLTKKDISELVDVKDEFVRASIVSDVNAEELREAFITNIETISTTPIVEELGDALGSALGGPLFEVAKQLTGATSSIDLLKKGFSGLKAIPKLPALLKTKFGDIKESAKAKVKETVTTAKTGLGMLKSIPAEAKTKVLSYKEKAERKLQIVQTQSLEKISEIMNVNQEREDQRGEADVEVLGDISDNIEKFTETQAIVASDQNGIDVEDLNNAGDNLGGSVVQFMGITSIFKNTIGKFGKVTSVFAGVGRSLALAGGGLLAAIGPILAAAAPFMAAALAGVGIVMGLKKILGIDFNAGPSATLPTDPTFDTKLKSLRQEAEAKGEFETQEQKIAVLEEAFKTGAPELTYSKASLLPGQLHRTKEMTIAEATMLESKSLSDKKTKIVPASIEDVKIIEVSGNIVEIRKPIEVIEKPTPQIEVTQQGTSISQVSAGRNVSSKETRKPESQTQMVKSMPVLVDDLGLVLVNSGVI